VSREILDVHRGIFEMHRGIADVHKGTEEVEKGFSVVDKSPPHVGEGTAEVEQTAEESGLKGERRRRFAFASATFALVPRRLALALRDGPERPRC
jgi:hypothetical protein